MYFFSQPFVVLLIFVLLFIGIAAGLTWFLLAHDRGEREPVGALWAAAGFGLLGAIIAGAVEGLLIPDKALMPSATLSTMFIAAMSVGFIEEVSKFLPLSLFIFRKRYFNEHTDGVIYFALAGLGFGLPENILYTLQYGSSAGLGRMILTPFFHAATTAIVGYYLARIKLKGGSPFKIVGPLFGAVMLHGLYDFGLFSGRALLSLMSVLITTCLSVGLFVLYGRAHDHDQAAGLSVIGNNSFCRSCGQANPQRLMYCAHCGQRA